MKGSEYQVREGLMFDTNSGIVHESVGVWELTDERPELLQVAQKAAMLKARPKRGPPLSRSPSSAVRTLSVTTSLREQSDKTPQYGKGFSAARNDHGHGRIKL